MSNDDLTPEEIAARAFADAARKRDIRVAYDRDRDPWRAALIYDDRRAGKLQSDLANAMVILENHPAWQGLICMDEFAGEIVKRRAAPSPHMKIGKWSDHDTTLLRQWFSQAEGLKLGKEDTDAAVLAIAQINGFNKVVQFIQTLPDWDGVRRLDTFIDDVFGTGQNEYFQFLGHHLMVTLIARALDPGCQVDEMLVLEGEQGIGKTSALRALMDGAPLHMSMRESPGNKDFCINLRGAWLVEIAEMQSFSKADVAAVKEAITTTVDKFRAPYDKHAREHPRMSIFAGSVNGSMYLSDPSGGRRFFPVPCTQANRDYITANRLQLFAEALVEFRAGFRWWDFPVDIARDMQESRYVQDSWENLIVEWLDGQCNHNLAYEDIRRDDISGLVLEATLADVLQKACGVEIGRQDVSTQKRATAILQRLGWKQVRPAAGSRRRVYRRPGLSTVDAVDRNAKKG